MKNIHFAFAGLCMAGLLHVPSLYGQQALSVKKAGPNVAAIDKSVIAGSYEIEKTNTEKGITEHINVNYRLSPAPFTNVLHLELGTSNPTSFTADIEDVKGNKITQWVPAAKSHQYKDDIDISNLAPGAYQLKIFSEINPEVAHTISFEKAGNN